MTRPEVMQHLWMDGFQIAIEGQTSRGEDSLLADDQICLAGSSLGVLQQY